MPALARQPSATARHHTTGSSPVLRAAPGFVQALTMDGRPYLVQEVEPYAQFWLSERERLLLALFARRGGLPEAAATAACLRLAGTAAPGEAAERRRIAQAVAGLRAAGVLLAAGDDTSRYDQRIVRDYLAHRPFPQPLASSVITATGLTADSRVLDLAGGPGDLALALARHTPHTTLLELSRGFLASARARARAQGLALQTVHDSANRLAQRDEPYDLITVAQALHWLDDVAVCRGAARLLRAGGSFVVVHSAIELADDHPLAYLLGHDSILGAKARRPFADEVQALQRRLALLFEALDAPDVDRIDSTHANATAGGLPRQRIAWAGVQLFDQPRPFGPGYARGFLTPTHIAATGQDEATFWADLQRRCDAAAPAAMQGLHRWAVLHFQRGAASTLRIADAPVTAIDYRGAPD
jgi:2-polyprenyl-3-methyl-5-hydroxy-6-metoxy-1,4-benzoquinol methylase